MYDYIKIVKYLSYKDTLLFNNIINFCSYANGNHWFYISVKFKQLKVCWNERDKKLTIKGSFPFFKQGHNFSFSNHAFYDSIETLEYLLGISLLNAEVWSFEYGLILQIEQMPSEIFSKHKELRNYESVRYKRGILYKNSNSNMKIYDCGYRIKTISRLHLNTLRNNFGFRNDANYCKVEKKYKNPNTIFQRDVILVEDLFNEQFQKEIKRDFLETYEAIDKAKLLEMPKTKKMLNSSTIPLLLIQQFANEFNFDVEERLFDLLNGIPSQILPTNDKTKRRTHLKENLKKLLVSDKQSITYDLAQKLQSALLYISR